MEKNKTGKYLKYAIGEIVLVVIGILIALQINNWNEKKIANQQLDDFLILMLDELSQDRAFFEKSLLRADKGIYFLNAISKKNYDQIAVEDFPGIVGRSFTNKKFGATYNNLKSEGKFNLIKDIVLKKRINNYYENNVSVYSDWATWNQKFVAENIEGHVMYNLPIKEGFKTDAKYLINEIENGNYLSMANFLLTFMKDFNKMTMETIELNNELVKLIETELKK